MTYHSRLKEEGHHNASVPQRSIRFPVVFAQRFLSSIKNGTSAGTSEKKNHQRNPLYFEEWLSLGNVAERIPTSINCPQRAYERKRSVKDARSADVKTSSQDLAPKSARSVRSADLVSRRTVQDLARPRRLQIPDLGFQAARSPELEVVQIREELSQISADLVSKTADVAAPEKTTKVSPDQIISNPIEEYPMSSQPVSTQPVLKAVVANPPEPDFWEGMQRALKKIDGERFLLALPSVVLLFGAAVAVGWLVWQQSIALYKSAGFEQPDLIAAGALIMVISFAAYHAVSRSKLALLLCLYAGGYETYFMVSGTVQDEVVEHTMRVEKDPELTFLGEKAEKARAAYQGHKTRYEDPTSDMHNNNWFKSKYLDPAWAANETAQQSFLAKKLVLESAGTSAHVTWLKVLYRLGLVFLCIILAHELVRKLR